MSSDNINLWIDPWITTNEGFKALNASPRSHPDQKVADIINKRKGIWSLENIVNDIPPNLLKDIQDIQNISLGVSYLSNQLIWQH